MCGYLGRSRLFQTARLIARRRKSRTRTVRAYQAVRHPMGVAKSSRSLFCCPLCHLSWEHHLKEMWRIGPDPWERLLTRQLTGMQPDRKKIRARIQEMWCSYQECTCSQVGRDKTASPAQESSLDWTQWGSRYSSLPGSTMDEENNGLMARWLDGSTRTVQPTVEVERMLMGHSTSKCQRQDPDLWVVWETRASSYVYRRFQSR